MGNNHTLQITADVVVYVEELFMVHNYASIELLGNATMTVYFEKDALITNNVDINTNTADPSRFVIYNLGITEFQLSNLVALYAQVFAPVGGILIENNAHLYGNYAGKDFHIKNTGGFHADTSGRSGGWMCSGPLNDTAGTAGVAADGAITSAASFDEWFRDVLGENLSSQSSVTLWHDGAGVYEYLNAEFYPADDTLLGNEGQVHNYNFTYATLEQDSCFYHSTACLAVAGSALCGDRSGEDYPRCGW